MKLTEAELSNLIIACNTSSMRNGSVAWQLELNRLAFALAAERSQLYVLPAINGHSAHVDPRTLANPNPHS